MSDFVTLTCPSCGGKLQITNDIDRFACGHCGNEHVVKRSGGIVALAPVVEGLAKVQVGVDKTASELAIARLEREIADLRERDLQARCRIIDIRYEEKKLSLWQRILRDSRLAAKAEAETKNRIATLEQEIANKEQELRHHRQMVSTKR
jgi:hypothetical protein